MSASSKPIYYEGTQYPDFKTLWDTVGDPMNVSYGTACSRWRAVNSKGLVCDSSRLRDILIMSVEAYKKRHGVRKTIMSIEGCELDLGEVYKELKSATTPYPKFRSRLVNLIKRGTSFEERTGQPFVLTQKIVGQAATYDKQRWNLGWGASNIYPIVYGDELYPTIRDWVDAMGRNEDVSMIRSRIFAGMDPERALKLPRALPFSSERNIYIITQLSTRLEYVGLTTTSIEERWRTHWLEVETGKVLSPLHKAMLKKGRQDFQIEPYETGFTSLEALAAREVALIAQRQTLVPDGLNGNKGGSLGGGSLQPCEYDGVTYGSVTERNFLLGEQHGVAPWVIARRINDKLPVSGPARTVFDEHLGDEQHQRQWLALMRDADEGLIELDPDLRSAKVWVDVIAPSENQGLVLVHLDPSQPFSQGNFKWMTNPDRMKHQHGKSIFCHGQQYFSLQELADAYDVKVSTLKNRLFQQFLTPEQAVATKRGPTSAKPIFVDGERFPSITRAAKTIAERFVNVTADQARDRLKRKVPICDWPEPRK